MATLVSFHAHPDDEAINCGGTLAKAAAEGHRVVVVVATGGELGEVADGFLGPTETLAVRRATETHAAAAALGVHRVAFLGYRDSGMEGAAGNDHPDCFWRADVDEAAARLAAILVEESTDVLTVYDDHGLYGHPDHVQVHRVGTRAAELAGTGRVYESTMDRDYVADLTSRAAAVGMTRAAYVPDPASFGTPSALVTTVVDVRGHLDAKRRAMAAHASQIAETSFFLDMPAEAFVAVWGQEWYIRRGGPAPAAERETTLFEGLG